jgi:HAD superfamily hydrolase (TIGR01662 family)
MGTFFLPSHKKVIFFDMNNTLLDRRKCFDSAFMGAVSEFTARWDQDDRSWTAQDALQCYKQEWSKHRNSSVRGTLSPQELRQLCLRKAMQPYPLAINMAFTKSFFEKVEQQEDSYVSLFPGVNEALEALSDRYKLAIISNGNRRRLEINLTKLKLDKWIRSDQLFSSTGDIPRKPHPAIFEAAMKSMATSAGQSIMVGNSWKNDVLGATRCGLDAVWIHAAHIKKVSQRKLGKQKVIIVRSVEQLIHIL